jgi:sec-independent protein translocase protein TatA
MGFLARPEVWAILLVAFVFFGAKRLPEAGSAIGKTIKEFQKSMHEVTEPEKSAAIPASQSQQLAASTPAAPAVTPPVVDTTAAERPSTSAQ